MGSGTGNDFTNNAWPTFDDNYDLTNIETDKYDGIIDNKDELATATGSKRYRLAKDITITGSIGNVSYELNGNGKQISTSSMIFDEITGKVYDLTVYVSESLVANNKSDDTDFMAPLAYALYGETAEIRDVKVKMAKDKYIQAANPAGLVVWAGSGAKISNCDVTAEIKTYLNSPKADELKFAGGVVSTASKVTITQCVFHSASKLSSANSDATASYFGGIVGGVNTWNGETPELTITDCTSFCKNYLEGTDEDNYHGGILGYAVYDSKNATTKYCQGNWWPDNNDGKISKGVAVYASGSSVEATIGKRNAVRPTEK